MKIKALANLPYALFFLFFCGVDAFIYPYINLYFTSRGLAGTQIGLINGLAFVITILSGMVFGAITDKSGRPRQILIFAMVASAASILYLSMAAALVHLYLATILYTFMYVPGGDLGDKLLLDHLGKSSRSFALFRFNAPLGYCVGVLAAGFIGARMGLVAVFHGGILVMGVSILTVLFMASPKSTPAAAQRAPVRQVAGHPAAPYFYGVMALWGFVESGALPYLSVFMDGAGYTTGFTAVLISVAMAGQMLGYLAQPSIRRLVKPQWLVSVAFLFMAVRIGAFVWVGQLPLAALVASQLVGGLSLPFLLATITQMIGAYFTKEASSTAQTLKTVANRGVGGSLGVILYGWLYSLLPAYSVIALFALLSLLCGGATLFMARLLAKTKPAAAG